MNSPEMRLFFDKLGAAFLDHAIPFFTLVTLLSLLLWVLFQAQKRNDFDASQFLRDERNFLSAGRLFAFGCFVIHSWAFSVWVIRGVCSTQDTLIYCATWSGSLLLLRAMDVYRGVKLNVAPPDLVPVPQPPGSPGDSSAR